MATARLFLAFDVDREVTKALARIQRELASVFPRTKWVNRDAMHLTVRFLGDTPMEAVAAIDTAVTEAVAGRQAVTCSACGLGVFPNRRRPAVIWAGIDLGGTELTSVAESIRESLPSHGFGEESKPFSPHITLGRIRRGTTLRRSATDAILDSKENERFGRWTVDRVVLYRSTLTPDGAVYDALQTWAL